MSSYGEDIIRETFEKLGDAIGVQMQMPDAMIANLGAVLQAQIDLLAELQSTGRLIPAGGRGLEFSEVEALRSAWEELKGYRVDGYARPYVNQMVKVVGALFPATEPAAEAPNLAAVAQEPRRFDPADECQNDNHDPGCVCGAQHWMTASAPAEPAEEETKAEEETALLCSHPMCRHTNWGGRNRKHLRFSDCPIVPVPDSSPVVPAPTETGPWQRIEDVPEGVLQIKDRHGRTWLVVGGTWRFEWHDGNWHEPHTNINAQAPFVAAAEEG